MQELDEGADAAAVHVLIESLNEDGYLSDSLEDIAEQPLITYHPSFTGRTRIDNAFAAKQLTPRIALEAIDSDVIKTYVGLGMGVGIVAEMAVRDGLSDDLVVRDAPLIDRDTFNLDLAGTIERLPYRVTNRRVERLGDCSLLDLHAVAKGWIVDHAVRAGRAVDGVTRLVRSGKNIVVSETTVSAGGHTIAYAETTFSRLPHRDGTPAAVAVDQPKHYGRGELPLPAPLAEVIGFRRQHHWR